MVKSNPSYSNVVLSTSLVVTLIFLPAVGSMIERKTAQMKEENKEEIINLLKYMRTL